MITKHMIKMCLQYSVELTGFPKCLTQYWVGLKEQTCLIVKRLLYSCDLFRPFMETEHAGIKSKFLCVQGGAT